MPLRFVGDVWLLIIAYLTQDHVKMEKEVTDHIIRHQKRVKDILR
jgi:hypothetical protein